MILEAAIKRFFLFLSQNYSMNRAAKKWGLRYGASRFVAGETIREAISKVKELNAQGLTCTLDHLGEFVRSRREAIESADYCIKTLDAIHQAGVDSNLSLKLTQLGLDIDTVMCRENMRRILERAKQYGNFVRIDMEDYSHCQQTLNMLHELRKEYDNVGTVIQAYLYRSESDVKALRGVPLRLVKGAYKESSKVAYPDKKDVDDNYKRIIKQHLLSRSYTAVATHDEHIIDYTKGVVLKHRIPHTHFEFQMLYGIRTQLQLSLAREGYKMRVYVPYGNDWYAYFMRRLAERPANVAFVLKGMVTK
ncbi:proline dehydrogenase [Aneurinibacillus migulanus]|uniref:proline dehydrogenase family protein n=1 Tax=Aneurinibacillus migulanus TaxID=47500 RepID=UPI0005B98F1C|nr:proline dehydrogenase [Aneurinibacillus migulanus]KIV52624.1 proline dehydrogenase [Aneurinibacillus migulanus]KPD04917.1 proline dehydrogenase [Aneurinibacillus migulanus]MCP1357318.1 proline dehydrogenase [Aneurinibacillus migulanus]